MDCYIYMYTYTQLSFLTAVFVCFMLLIHAHEGWVRHHASETLLVC
jgi:hypothetical protein